MSERRRLRSSGVLFTALLLCAAAAAVEAFEVVVEPEEPRPGEVVRVELIGLDNPRRADCRFRSKSYPFYMLGPGRMRALVGLTAKQEPGWHPLKVSRIRFLLPDEIKTTGIMVGERKFTHQKLRMPKKRASLTGKPKARKGTRTIRETVKRESRRQRWSGPFLRPAKGRRTSEYGHTRTYNDGRPWSWHKGVDIAAPKGRPVRAPNEGRVALTDFFPIQGRTLLLDHGQGLMSAFFHLDSFRVSAGDKVEKGEIVAEVGGTGFSTGPHLHWGAYLHGDPVDPELLLKREF